MEDFKIVFNYEEVDPAKSAYIIHMKYGMRGIPIELSYVHDCNRRDFIITSDASKARKFSSLEDAKKFLTEIQNICMEMNNEGPELCEKCQFYQAFEIQKLKVI